MSTQIVTIISGVGLLFVFVLVGWNLRRKRTGGVEVGDQETNHESR